MPVSVENDQGKEEELSIKNEELRGSTPCIPDEVYANLPDFLKAALIPARTQRERDMLLLGLIANLSGCLPLVRINFDQRFYSPHLYILIIAPSATGKGLLTLAGMLPREIENYLKGENKRKKDTYERELMEWERKQSMLQEGDADRRSIHSRPEARSTGILPLMRCSQHLQKPNHPTAEK